MVQIFRHFLLIRHTLAAEFFPKTAQKTRNFSQKKQRMKQRTTSDLPHSLNSLLNKYLQQPSGGNKAVVAIGVAQHADIGEAVVLQ